MTSRSKVSAKSDPPPPPNGDAEAALSYEAAMARLEKVVAQLESGDLPLEQALALYEEGTRLAQLCAALLDAAELRVRQWQVGDASLPLDDWSAQAGE